jgi:hypothetical protein
MYAMYLPSRYNIHIYTFRISSETIFANFKHSDSRTAMHPLQPLDTLSSLHNTRAGEYYCRTPILRLQLTQSFCLDGCAIWNRKHVRMRTFQNNDRPAICQPNSKPAIGPTFFPSILRVQSLTNCNGVRCLAGRVNMNRCLTLHYIEIRTSVLHVHRR